MRKQFMERPGNIMPSSILLILFFLIWLTSKIIFIFFEKNQLKKKKFKNTFKRQKFEGSILRRLKLSLTHNRSEIIATIFHAALNAYSFIITLSVVTYYVDAEACEYICNHMEFFIFFDIVITMTILTTQKKSCFALTSSLFGSYPQPLFLSSVSRPH